MTLAACCSNEFNKTLTLGLGHAYFIPRAWLSSTASWLGYIWDGFAILVAAILAIGSFGLLMDYIMAVPSLPDEVERICYVALQISEELLKSETLDRDDFEKIVGSKKEDKEEVK